MADNFDLPIPTVSGTTIQIDWLRNNPVKIYRLLRTLVMQNLIGWRLLKGRKDLTGSGFGIFEVTESIFTQQQGSIVRPLSQYPLTQGAPPTLASVRPDKNGLKTIISDEDVAHNDLDKVLRELRKIANRLVFQNDALALAAIASLVVKTTAGTATWDGTTSATPFLDVLRAAAAIEEENQGYVADTVATTPTKFANAIGSAVAAHLLPREDAANAIQSNINNIRIANLTWVKTTNMPSGVNAIVLDSTMLGGMAYERLGGGYNGDPADDQSGVESKRYREDDVDGVVVQARIVRAPMIQEPNSARIVTGV